MPVLTLDEMLAQSPLGTAPPPGVPAKREIMSMDEIIDEQMRIAAQQQQAQVSDRILSLAPGQQPALGGRKEVPDFWGNDREVPSSMYQLAPTAGNIPGPRQSQLPPGTTIGDAAKEYATQVIHGTGQVVAAVPKGIAFAADFLQDAIEGGDNDVRDLATFKYGQALEDYLNDALPPDPRFREDFNAQVMNGLGQVVGFYLTSGLGGPGRAGETLNLTQKALRFGELAVPGAGISASQAYDEAIAQGAAPHDAELYARYNGLIGGATEPFGAQVFPISSMRIVDRLDKATGGLIHSAIGKLATGFTREMLQEEVQQGLSNVAARKVLKDERPIFQGVWQAGKVGGAVGAIVEGIRLAAGVKLRKPIPPGPATTLGTAGGAGQDMGTVGQVRRQGYGTAQTTTELNRFGSNVTEYRFGEPETQTALREQTQAGPFTEENARRIVASDLGLAAHINNMPPTRKAFHGKGAPFEGIDSTYDQRVAFKRRIAELVRETPTSEAAPLSQQPQAAPAAQALQPTRISEAARKARTEFTNSVDELGRYLEGKTFANPLDPELVKLAGKVVLSGVKAGATSLADLMNRISSSIGRDRAETIRNFVALEWTRITALRVNEGSSDVLSFVRSEVDMQKLANETRETQEQGGRLFFPETTAHEKQVHNIAKAFKEEYEIRHGFGTSTVRHNPTGETSALIVDAKEIPGTDFWKSNARDYITEQAYIRARRFLEDPEGYAQIVEQDNAARRARNKAIMESQPEWDWETNTFKKRPLTEKMYHLPDAAKRILNRRQGLSKAIRDLTQYVEGRTFSTPLDPKLIRLVSKVAVEAVKSGVQSFSDFVHHIANRIGSALTRKIAPAIRDEWNKLRKGNPELEEAGDIEAILAERTGRPELANPAAAPEARELVRDVDEARKAAGIPVERHDADVQQEADARLAADREGEKRRLLAAAARGGNISDVDTVVAMTIVRQDAPAALQSEDIDQIREVMELSNAYRTVRTEAGRTLRIGRDPAENPAKRNARVISEAILTPPKKGRDAYDRAKQKGDEQGMRDALDDHAKEVNKLKRKLKLGVDIDQMDTWQDDPVKTSRAVNTIAAAKSDVWDVMYEYWRNSVLSALNTQEVNIIGNASNMTWYFTAGKIVSATLRSAGLNPQGARWGELKQIAAAFLPSFSKASRNFLMSWDAETPFFEHELGVQQIQKIEDVNIAIPGKLGRIVRIPQRLLGAADAFGKTQAALMEVAAMSHRLALDSGLKANTDEYRRFVATQLADHNSQAWMAAIDTAHELTFVSRKGRALPLLLKARREIPGIRYLMPFVTTPVNIFKLGTRMSPLGSIPLAMRVWRAFKTGDWKLIDKRIAEQVLAWAAVGALMSNDEDDPWITGAAKYIEKGPREFAYRGGPQPQSIKIGGEWYSYARLEPFATAVALTVDFTNAMKSGDVTRTADPVNSIVQQMKDKTFLRGIGDLMRMTEPGQTLENVAKFASNFAASWVPNLIRSGLRSAEEKIPERGVWGEGDAFANRLMKRALQKTELGIVPDVPKYDVWGKPVDRQGSPVPGTDWAYRMLVPFKYQKDDMVAPDRALLNWNNKHPGQEKYVFTPSKSYIIDDQIRYMTDEEYATFSKVAGERASMLVNKLLMDAKVDLNNPTKAQMDAMKNLISEARELTRKEFVIAKQTGKPFPIPRQP